MCVYGGGGGGDIYFSLAKAYVGAPHYGDNILINAVPKALFQSNFWRGNNSCYSMAEQENSAVKTLQLSLPHYSWLQGRWDFL